MARYLCKQALLKLVIDSDLDLVITQQEETGDEYSIYISRINIDNFIELIQSGVKDGYVGDDDEVV